LEQEEKEEAAGKRSSLGKSPAFVLSEKDLTS
jgi:hypothetical protein